jgi:hypothetical protein
MYIIDTNYHVDLVNAISNILFNLIYVCVIWFEIFMFGEKVLIYETH